jgi:subtilisin family serine protease
MSLRQVPLRRKPRRQRGDSSSRRLLLEQLEDRRLLTFLVIDSPSQLEHNGIGSNDLIFTVSRTGDTSTPATVRFATTDGTATDGIDYHAHSGQLTFRPGTTQQLIRVTLLRDDVGELDEDFLVELTAAEGAEIEEGTGRGTILNDDAAIVIDDASVVEGDSGTFADFSVRLAVPAAETFTVDYATEDGTANAGIDYSATSGRLTFPANQTQQTIRIPVIGDTELEDDESFFVQLSRSSGPELLIDRAVGTILDDDAERPEFSPVEPLGSLIYDRHQDASIGPGEVGISQIDLEPNQTITVVVDSTSSLITKLELLDPTGRLIGEVTDDGSSHLITLGPVHTTVSGPYRLSVSSSAGTAGDYSARYLVNAAFEQESSDGTSNDTFLSAQDIGDSFISVGTAGASRGAVIALADDTPDSVGPDAFGYLAAATSFEFEDIRETGAALLSDDDDSSVLLTRDVLAGFAFELYGVRYSDLYVSSNGLITFGVGKDEFRNSSLESFPTGPAIAPLWDDLDSRASADGTYWEVRGNPSERRLIIQWNEVHYFDSRDVDPITFQAILFEADGSIQFNYLDLAGGSRSRNGGQSATVGIRGAEDNQRLLIAQDDAISSLVGSGSSVQISAQSGSDPRSLDFYRFQLDGGDSVTLVLTAPEEVSLTLDLFDAAQNQLAAGIAEQPNNQLIHNLLAAQSGDFYAQVSGDGQQYSLVVIANGDFNMASNDGLPTAQALLSGATALGYLSAQAPAEVGTVGSDRMVADRSAIMAIGSRSEPRRSRTVATSLAHEDHDDDISSVLLPTIDGPVSSWEGQITTDSPHISAGPAAEYSSNRLIVRFADEVSSEERGRLLAKYEGAFVHDLPLINGATIDVSGAGDLLSAAATWNADPLVVYAEPDYRVYSQAIPDDTSFEQLWGLHNTGQSGGTIDADIDAPEAWDILTGSRSVVVASVDGGVDYTHVDLKDNMWMNPGEIPDDGIDNDQNGFVDDIYGVDTVNNDSDPFDDNGHGTHTAGTMGAVGNNATGGVGVNWNVQIMALKFLDSDGNGFVSDAIQALNYMTMMRTDYGINVVASNNSWSGSGPSVALRDAIQGSNDAGILFIASAGNTATDNDATPSFPGSFDLAGVITVAATDRNDRLASFSSFGATSVDLAAPGVSILSTRPGDRYSLSSGTSMAAPHVAGAIAMLMAHNPDTSLSEAKAAILAGSDPLDTLTANTVSGGRLNLANSLALIGDPGDFYRIWATAGDSLVVATSTPADGLVAANLDPGIELYSPAGDLVTFDDNSAPDGRNSELQFTVTVTGDHSVRILSSAGRGAYALSIRGQTGLRPPSFVVADLDPSDGQRLNTTPTAFDLNLARAVLISSLDASDLEIDGTPATSFDAMSGRTIRFAAPELAAGEHTAEIAAGSLLDLQGNPIGLFSSQFTIDLTPPRVVSSSVLTADVVAAGNLTYSVRFSEPLQGANLDPSDILLIGQLSGRHEPLTLSYDSATQTVSADFANLPDDRYSLALHSGDLGFEDLAGNDLDGDGSELPSGDSISGGDFERSFFVDSSAPVLTPFKRLTPLGALLFSSQGNRGLIHAPTDSDRFQFFAEFGQALSVEVVPNDQEAAVTLALINAEGVTIRGPVTGTPGGVVRLPADRIDGSGEYGLSVSADVSTTYELSAGLNFTGGAAGDEALVPLDGSLSAERFAAIGTSVPQRPQLDNIVWGAQPSSGMIVSIDPRTGSELYGFPAPGGMSPGQSRIGLSMAEGGQTLLYVNSDVDPTQLYRLDPLTGATLSVESIDSASGIAYDGLDFASPRVGVTTIYSANMDVDPGWTLEGGWSYGRPAGGGSENLDPSAGFTGRNVVGYNLSGDYSNRLAPAEHAVTPPIDASGYDHVNLSFRRWLGVEGARFDRAVIEVSRNGVDWVQIWENPRGADVTDISWAYQTFDISSVADGKSTVLIRWAMGPTNGTTTLPGWNMDDVVVTGVKRDTPSLLFGQYAGGIAHQNGVAGEVTNRFPVASGALGGDDAGRQFLFVPSSGIQEYSFAEASIVRTIPTPAADVQGLAFDGTFLYASSASGALYTLDPDTGAVLHQSIVSGGGLFGLGATAASGREEVVYREDFDGPSHGFSFNNSVGAGNGLWHVTTGRSVDGLSNHSASSLYFGKAEKNFGGGNYDVGTASTGFAISPDISLPAATPLTLSFNSLISTERSADHLDVLVFDGTLTSPLLSTRDDVLSSSTSGVWRTITADLTSHAGKDVRLLFLFSADSSANNFEGWYVDDLQVTLASDDFDFQIPDVDSYTLDLTGRVGQTIDIVLEGQDSVDFSSAVLALVDPDETVLATASAHPAEMHTSNYDLAILDFVVPHDGVYSLQSTSVVEGIYSITVFVSTQFDSEPNDDPAGALRKLTDGTRTIGHVRVASSSGRLFAVETPTAQESGVPEPGTIHELDPVSGAIVNSFPTPNLPGTNPFGINLAFDGSSLWYNAGALVGDNLLYRLNPDTGVVLNTRRPFGTERFAGLAAVGNELFAIGDLIQVYDTRTPGYPIVRTIPAPSRRIAGLAGNDASGTLFVFAQGTSGAGSFYEINPQTGALLRRITADSTLFEQGLAVVGDAIFVSETAGTEGPHVVAVYDQQTLSLTRRMRMPVQPGALLAGLGGDGFSSEGPDYFSLDLIAGQELVVYTETPFANEASSPGNGLDPALALYDADGLSIARATGGEPNNKNARLSIVVAATGAYVLEVSAETGSGEYVLRTQIVETTSISGRKFHDLNQDGVRGSSEEYLNGWTVELLDQQGAVLEVQQTRDIDRNLDGTIDAATERGWYQFNVEPGTYTIREVMASGWRQTAPVSRVELAAFTLDQMLDLFTTGNLFVNWGGEGEVWLQAANDDDRWYFITPNGVVSLWDTMSGIALGSPLSGAVVARLNEDYHADPTRLIDAPPPTGTHTVTIAAQQKITDRDFGNFR